MQQTTQSRAFCDVMLFALGLCSHRAGMGLPCRLSVTDSESDEPTPESLYCAAHQPAHSPETAE